MQGTLKIDNGDHRMVSTLIDIRSFLSICGNYANIHHQLVIAFWFDYLYKYIYYLLGTYFYIILAAFVQLLPFTGYTVLEWIEGFLGIYLTLYMSHNVSVTSRTANFRWKFASFRRLSLERNTRVLVIYK